MDYPKNVTGVGLVNGKFVDEDVVSGTPGSLIPASWGNGVTDELLAVIQAAQLDPNEEDLDQLLEAIRYIVQDDTYIKERVYNKEEMDALLKNNNAVPIGMMVPFPKADIPPGFLEVDGSLQSIAAYPDLAAYLGTKFNQASDPAGYFRLPESRGEFLRGWDHGRGVDAGRGLGTFQDQSLGAHAHKDTGFVDNVGGGSGATGVTGAVAAASSFFGKVYGSSSSTTAKAYVESSAGSLGGAIAGLTSGSAGGTETRPRNIAVVWCIKAWSAPINQGNIDVAALADQVQKFSVNGPVVGSVRRGAMRIPSPSATATYTADELVVETALGGLPYRLASFSQTINLSTIGVGGMDTGTSPASGFVAIYAIYNPATKARGLIGVNAASKVSEVYNGSNMPTGYTASCLLTVVPTTSGGGFGVASVSGRDVTIQSAYVYTSTSVVANVLVTPNNVPANAVTIGGVMEQMCTSATQLSIGVSSGDTVTGTNSLTGYVMATGTSGASFYNLILNSSKQFILTTSLLSGTSGTPTFKIAVSRYSI
ncbi:phage tail protein [Pseudomonas sp. NPDC089734]|uniref:phage tail protein n=1 Tax=Pseudomonas sp. NPDC089734 TaxID=3364469 RepID=UPI00382FEEBA